MTPLYEYRCRQGHVTERLCKYDERDEMLGCDECGHPAHRVPSAHHRQPDGIYSYAPNVGTPELFERKNAKARGELDPSHR